MKDKYRHVNIDKNEITKWIERIEIQKDSPSLVDGMEFRNFNERLNFLFLFCVLNFCFWSDEGWKYNGEGKVYSGSTAVIKSLYASYKEGRLNLDVDSIINMSFVDFERMVKGEGTLHLMKERYTLVIESFKVLKVRFEGSVDKLIQTYNFDAELLMNELPKILKAFEDKYIYQEKTKKIGKKVQVFISNLNKIYSNKPFKNTDKFTLFADYRLPQLFRHLGFLKYTQELEEIIDTGKIIKKDSEFEMEVRLATIDIGEFILETHPNKDLTSMDLDGFFWGMAKAMSDQMKPHHRTITTLY